MLAALKAFFNEQISTDASIPDQQAIQIAACALMFEIATIDQQLDKEERQQLQRQLQRLYPDIAVETLQHIEQLAEQEQRQSTSLYGFTQLINNHFDYAHKCQLFSALWSIAKADGNVDKYEAHMLRRLADLLHISHHDYIMAKQQS